MQPEALHQIRIGDKRHAESHQIGLAPCHHLIAFLLVITGIGDECAPITVR